MNTNLPERLRAVQLCGGGSTIHNEAATEIERLTELLETVAKMGVDPENGIDDEWLFVEDAAQFVKDNL